MFEPSGAQGDGDVDVTARIRLIRYRETVGPFETFGIVARASDRGSDAFGVCHDCANGSIIGLSISGFEQPLAERPFDPRTDWHDYTLRLRGVHVIGLIDGHQIFDLVESEHVGGTGVGLWSSGAALEVASFTMAPAK